jgi:hypothetical protein
MFGDRFHRKFKYSINTLFKNWAADLVDYTLEKFPYLNRRKEFELWFNLPGEREAMRMVVRPKEK